MAFIRPSLARRLNRSQLGSEVLISRVILCYSV
jgi:hypothetical protein